MAPLSSPSGEYSGFSLQLKIYNCLFNLCDIYKDVGYVHLNVNPHPA